MEALKMEYDTDAIRAKLREIRDTKGRDGTGLSGVERAANVNRATISQFVNKGILPTADKVRALWEYLEAEYGDIGEARAMDARPIAYGAEIAEKGADGDAMPSSTPEAKPMRDAIKTDRRLYFTRDYARAWGKLDELSKNAVESWQAEGHGIPCVMIGFPGTGKTTVLREYVRRHDNVYYINCWAIMTTKDILEEIASAMGMTLGGGTRMQYVKQIMAELSHRPGAMLIYDECENLLGYNYDKIETLRKLCDDTPTAAVFAGTNVFENALIGGGSGRKNLAQIYRRNHAIKMEGVHPNEVKDMLAGYNVSPAAKDGLTQIATDVKFGGLGNFVEILRICGELAQGGEITAEVLSNAKKYKLMHR